MQKRKIKKDPFEIFGFLVITPLYSKVTPWISVPIAFLQATFILVVMLLLFNTESTTTAIRVPLSGGGIIGAILSIGILRVLLEFVYYNLFLVVIGLVIFYIYAFATKKSPKFKWLDEEEQ